MCLQDEGRFCTRISNSTLCSSSSLSLSSGHTSGYVSGHTTQLKDTSRLHPPTQVWADNIKKLNFRHTVFYNCS